MSTTEEKAENGDESAAQQSKPTKAVSFRYVEIREYERIVGDNPAVSSGPSVTLDWKHQSSLKVPFQDYEDSRPPRRTSAEFQMPSSVRRQMVRDAPMADIRHCHAEVKRVQQNRRLTVAFQEWEGTQLAFERLRRKLRRVRTGVSSKQEQENLWETAVAASVVPPKTLVDEAATDETDDSDRTG